MVLNTAHFEFQRISRLKLDNKSLKLLFERILEIKCFFMV